MNASERARRVIVPSGKHRLVFGVRRRVWATETSNPPPAEPKMDSIWGWKETAVEDIPHIS